jgi:flagellar basal body-associated protein FliL
MDTVTIIIGIILFAIATMIIYAWGLSKQRRQSSDLMNLLFSKGEAKVKKHLKKNEYITLQDVEKFSENLEAKMPFSANRAVVKNKRDYAQKLLAYMVKTGQIEQEGNRYKKVKK